VRLMEQAGQGRSRYVRLADRITRHYTPAVHLLAIGAFAYWITLGAPWTQALLVATTVLVITCPCALALAVPVVQVIASGILFRRGVFLKSGDALERLGDIEAVAFDKTGTLTLGRPEIKNPGALSARQWQAAASMAARSRHPLAKAVLRRYQGPLLDLAVAETPGSGLEAVVDGAAVRLGSRAWCRVDAPPAPPHMTEVWYADGGAPKQLLLEDRLRPGAAATVAAFREAGIAPLLLSGDREDIVARIAARTGIASYRAALPPAGKIAALGKKTLMVGDGLNDAPALMAAHVSMSPAAALDIAQNAADIVFQGDSLAPVFDAWRLARRSRRIIRQNLAFSILYNLCAVPLAMAGHVTPLVAALAMSSSSLIVIANSFRLKA
jgi:Cu2+-exporting ATPase